MTYRIRCAYQTSEGFDYRLCASCPKFSMSMGKTTNYHCKMQNTPEEKRNFEGVMLSWVLVKCLGIQPDAVEVLKDGC